MSTIRRLRTFGALDEPRRYGRQYRGSTGPREHLLRLAVATGFDPIRVWSACDFLRQTGVNESDVLSMATTTTLGLWTHPDTPNG